jgi:hypothetical protein
MAISLHAEVGNAFLLDKINLTRRTGNHGTTIWHVPSGRYPIETPTFAGNRGMTTAVTWMTKRDNTDEGLAFGTEDGHLVVWKRDNTANNVSHV